MAAGFVTVGPDNKLPAAVQGELSATYGRGENVFDVRHYGAELDERRVYDAAITAGTTTITSATAGFHQKDVGKLASIRGANATYGHMVGTITTVNSATSVTINPADSVTDTVSGAELIWGTDDTLAIQSAVNEAAATGRKCSVYVPGRAVVGAPGIELATKVSIHGEGPGASCLTPIGSAGNFLGTIHGHGSAAAPWFDIAITNLELDCENMMASQGAGGVAWKGIFVTYVRRFRAHRLYVHGSPFTGIGVDFLPDGIITDCVAIGCGRSNDGTALGGAGIGIGTGRFAVENITVANCHSSGNGTYGIFFERNGSFLSEGARAIGNYVSGNRMGLGDCGTARTIWANNTVSNNTVAGVEIGAGTTNVQAGYQGLLSDNIIIGNPIGVHWDVTSSGTTERSYRIINNQITSSTGDGIFIEGGDISLANISGNSIRENGGAGIHIATGVIVKDGDIEDNDLRKNASTLTLEGSVANPTRIMNNRGYNGGLSTPESITPGPTTSPFVYTAGPTPEMIYIIGDSSVNISTHGGTVMFGNGSIRLEPYQNLNISWTGTLTSVKRKKF